MVWLCVVVSLRYGWLCGSWWVEAVVGDGCGCLGVCWVRVG